MRSFHACVVEPVLASLAASVSGVVTADLDALPDAAVRESVAAAERAARRLSDFRSRGLSVLAARAADTARAEQPRDSRAQARAERAVEQELAGQLGISPGEVKRARRSHAELATVPDARGAAAVGEISAEHACIIADTTRRFHDDDDASRSRRPFTPSGAPIGPTTRRAQRSRPLPTPSSGPSRPGPWDVADTILLCRRHHRLADRPDWRIEIDAETARVTFHPPHGRAPLVSEPPQRAPPW